MALLRKRKMSRKARMLLAGGMLCLFAGVELPMIFPHAAGPGLLWLDGAHGFLLGMAICLNLGAVLAGAQRCRG